ncbi:hypothetical protein HDR59_01345 [bacterium]|nr:hypothetical protein [bacterium]
MINRFGNVSKLKQNRGFKMNIVQIVKRIKNDIKEEKEIKFLNKDIPMDSQLYFNDGNEGENSLPFYSCFNASTNTYGNPYFTFDPSENKYYIPLKNGKKLYITNRVREGIQQCMDIHFRHFR